MIASKTTTSQKIILVFFSLFLGIVSIEIGLRIAGAILLHFQERANITSLEEKGEFVILCLGESTTFSMYPRFLEQVLNERNKKIKFSVIDKGVPGIHTTYIVSKLEENLDRYKPDMVMVMMGANDRADTKAYTNKQEKALNSLDVRSRGEGIREFLSNLRAYKLVSLLYQQIRYTLKDNEAQNDFIKENMTTDYREALNKVQLNGDDITTGEIRSSQVEWYIKKGDKYWDNDELDKASAAYREALGLDTENNEAIGRLTSCLCEWGRYREAEVIYREFLQTHPDDYLAQIELGIILQDQDKGREAQFVFDKAFKLQPGLVEELLRLASEYRNRGRDEIMKKYCKMAIAVAPDNYHGYLELGRLYLWQNQKAESEKTLKKSIELNPKNGDAYALLGMLYERMARKEEAKQMYKWSLQLNPREWDATYSLIILYQREGNSQEAERLYRRMTELSPGNYRTWGALATFYQTHGKKDLAEEYYDRAEKLRLKSLNPATVQNYRKVYDILREKEITPVFIQYPMRHLKDLSDIFRDKTGIIFIDNEFVFKEAVKREGYVEYFNDHFAGDFGHCTHRGNQILAENIANSLFLDEEFFGRKNVLSSKDIILAVSSINSPKQNPNTLTDNNPSTYWHISLSQIGAPAWVVVDLGKDNQKKIKALAARPRINIPQQFFKNAELLGSNDRITWKPITPIIQEDVPPPYKWSQWSFKNSQTFQYYKLQILDGHEDGPDNHFYSMAELAMFE